MAASARLDITKPIPDESKRIFSGEFEILAMLLVYGFRSKGVKIV